jgi:formylglycine-generating enzyme required for sulfatase activity
VTAGGALGLDWRIVPGGPFTMGSDPAAEFPPEESEAPRHSVDVEAFRLGRTPVTNAQYRAFVEATGRPPACWPGGEIPRGRELHPVTYVAWDDAAAFCRWASGSLPTEAQWERAARGDDARTWPWGDRSPTPRQAVTGVEDTRPVGGRREGAGPFGHLDLAGNAWEWTSSLHRAYPYDAGDGREDGGEGPRVLRGGAFIHGPGDVRCSSRFGMLRGAVDHYVGHRLAAAPAGLDVDGIDLLDVPTGAVALGNDPHPSGGPTRPDEAPQAIVHVAAFELTTTPVTNEQYAAFVQATGRAAPVHWPGGCVPEGLERHPVTYVERDDAAAFCAWAGGRLPTEAEWEKAARGVDARLYPWGDDDPGPDRANAGVGARHESTAPVGESPGGASPYGVLDMAGNVWEWVSSAYRPYPYGADDGREDPAAPEQRALRGGSFASPTASHLRCARRSASWPGRRSAHIGFRVARSV